jgi:hypothetical protein
LTPVCLGNGSSRDRSPATVRTILGKISLWRHGVTFGGAHGYHVLASRSSLSEAELPFSGLADLDVVDGPPDTAPVTRAACTGGR